MTTTETSQRKQIIERLDLSLMLRDMVSQRMVEVAQEFEEVIDHALKNGGKQKVQRAFGSVDFK